MPANPVCWAPRMSEQKPNHDHIPSTDELCIWADELLESRYARKRPGNGSTTVASVHVVHFLPEDQAQGLPPSGSLYLLIGAHVGNGLRRYDFRQLGRSKEAGYAIAWLSSPGSALEPGLVGNQQRPAEMPNEKQYTLCQALQEGQPYDPERYIVSTTPDGSLSVALHDTDRDQQVRPSSNMPSTIGARVLRTLRDKFSLE